MICLGVRRQPGKGKVYWVPGGSSVSPVLQCHYLNVLVWYFGSFGGLFYFVFFRRQPKEPNLAAESKPKSPACSWNA